MISTRALCVILVAFAFFLVVDAQQFISPWLRPTSSMGMKPVSHKLGSSLPQPHVWQNVMSKNGTWYAKLSPVYENMQFTNSDATLELSGFYVQANTASRFGLVITEDDDFDIMFILTLLQLDDSITMESKKVCTFLISAYSPAKPQITAVPFNGGAQCTYEFGGTDIDFYVQ